LTGLLARAAKLFLKQRLAGQALGLGPLQHWLALMPVFLFFPRFLVYNPFGICLYR
jgi:hypothetical protein